MLFKRLIGLLLAFALLTADINIIYAADAGDTEEEAVNEETSEEITSEETTEEEIFEEEAASEDDTENILKEISEKASENITVGSEQIVNADGADESSEEDEEKSYSSDSSGSCGDDLTYIYSAGTLTISGSGEMTAFSSYTAVPWYSLRDEIEAVIIEDGVTSVGKYAFYNCIALTSVSLPDSLTDIGASAFYNCSGLPEIALPENLTGLGKGAFYYCTSLKSIVIPDGVTSIEANLFFDCSSLKEVTISKSAKSIGSRAFYFCTSLEIIKIPGKVSSIESNAFSGSGIQFVYCYEGSCADDASLYLDGTYFFYLQGFTLVTDVTGEEEIVYDSEFETYDIESFTLTVKVSNSCATLAELIFPESSTRETAENVTVTITLPEGFSFSEDDEEASTFSCDIEEIEVGTNNCVYAVGDVYVLSPEVGTAELTVDVEGDNIISTTETYEIEISEYEFDIEIAKADHYMSKSGTMENSFFYADFPSQALYDEAVENGLISASGLWDGFTNIVDTAEDVSNVIDLACEEKDIYTAIIMDIFETASDISDESVLSNEITKTSKDLAKTITSGLKDAYLYDNLSIVDIDISKIKSSSIEELLGDYFKEEHGNTALISKMTSYVSDAMDVVSSVEDYCNTVASYYAVMCMSASYKEILQEMYDNVGDNAALKSALKDCIEIMNGGEEEYRKMVLKEAAVSSGKLIGSYAVSKFWDGVVTSISVNFPAVYVLKTAYSASKLVSNLLFATDEITEQCCKIQALIYTEALLRNIYRDVKSTYSSSGSSEDARTYNGNVSVMFNMLDTDCEYALDYADAVDSAWIQKLANIFGDTDTSSYKSAVKVMQSSTYSYGERLSVGWIDELVESDYKRYEKYKYLKDECETRIQKKYAVECPVDIYVFDSEENLVGYIVDNSPYCLTSDGINLSVENDTKILTVYDSEEYTIVYQGNDTGSMDITVTEYDDEGNEAREVRFDDIALTDGLTYTSEETGTGQTYEITSVSGTEISSDYDSENNSGETFTVSIEKGFFTDTAEYSGEFYEAEKAEIYAYVPDGYVFAGWTSDAGTGIFDDTDSIVTEITVPASDVTITAVFAEASEEEILLGDVNGDGEVDVLDLAKLFDHIQEVETLTGTGLEAADMNSDSSIDVLDLALLFDKIQS